MERSSEALALEAVGGLWWDWNMVTGEVTRSEGLRAALGAPAPEHGYVSWIARVHPDDVARVQERLAAMLTSTQSHGGYSYRLALGGDGYTAVRDRIVVLRDGRGKPIRVAGVLLREPEGVSASGSASGVETGQDRDKASADVSRVLRGACHALNNARLVLDVAQKGVSARREAEGIGYALEQITLVSGRLTALVEGERPGDGAGMAEGGGDGEGWGDGRAIGDRLEGVVVLVVEDTDVVRRLLCESLRHAGCEVLEACDGVEGLAIVQRERERLDVGVTDLLMPRMGGLELIRRSGGGGEHEDEDGLPWLVLTGDPASAAEVRESVGLGRIKIASKPLEIAEVRRAVAALAGR